MCFCVCMCCHYIWVYLSVCKIVHLNAQETYLSAKRSKNCHLPSVKFHIYTICLGVIPPHQNVFLLRIFYTFNTYNTYILIYTTHTHTHIYFLTLTKSCYLNDSVIIYTRNFSNKNVKITNKFE